MFNDLFDLPQAFLQKGLPFLLSFLDDAILMGLSKLGVSIPFIPRLDMILFSINILYWSSYVIRFLYERYQEDKTILA